ncbi:MAG: FtsW/RodA/SpoVE family cell cycle protein [Microcoleaceae cyanobacterium]
MNIHRFFTFWQPQTDHWGIEARILRWITFFWLFLGLIMVFSASFPSGTIESGDGTYYFKRQLIWVLVGLVGFNFLVYTPLAKSLKVAKVGMIICLILIWLTNVPGLGTTINGATRWISIGPLPIQPSELMKPFLVMQCAVFFSQWFRLSWLQRWFWLGIFGLTLLGILAQPNLSTTALCGMTIWLVALASGLPAVYLSSTAIAGFVLGLLSITINEYQRKRILSFTNPWSDPVGDGYQLVQSLLAIGSGGVSGTGLGLSQQKLYFLPIQYSDFIFSVYAEEFGLIGGLLFLVMLIAYGAVALRVALRVKTMEYQLLAVGVMVIMIGQSLLNIGVASGVLPTTGLPLPLFSYGGSSMISSLILAGLLIRVAREGSTHQIIGVKKKFVLPKRLNRKYEAVKSKQY